MIKVTKEQFFNALDLAGKKGLDPMPQRKTNAWVCQKTFHKFGEVIHVGVGNKFDYYLTAA